MSFFSSCFSANFPQSDVSKSINAKLKEGSMVHERTSRILLLGAGESGKSTVLKQMENLYGVVDPDTLMATTKHIKNHIVGYMQTLIHQSETLQKSIGAPTILQEENQQSAAWMGKLPAKYPLDKATADVIERLWKDEGIKETLKLHRYYQIHDNVDYFFDKVREIASPSYVASFEDYVRFRAKTTGMTQKKFEAKIEGTDFLLDITDVGGQRSERKKWVHVFNDNINCVLFLVGLSGYDLNCFEDNKTNRLAEAIDLFEKMMDTKFFDGKTIILFLNKFDLFQEKIQRRPITVAFDDYPANEDPHNAEKAADFVYSKFNAIYKKRFPQVAKKLGVHKTTALDTGNIRKVITEITQGFVRGAMDDMRLL